MKLSNLSFHLLPTTTAAAAAIFAHDEDANIPATSRLGQSLLQNARSLGNNFNNNAQGGTSWLAGYSIKFHSCATGDYYGGGNNNNNEQNYDAQEVNNNNGFVYKQRLAHFQLCPSNTCSGSSKSGCNDYVTDLSDFLAMYVENKIEMEAMACENVKEICYCEDANDDEVSLEFRGGFWMIIDNCHDVYVVLTHTHTSSLFSTSIVVSLTVVLLRLLRSSWTVVL